jgi:hypothetical protein
MSGTAVASGLGGQAVSTALRLVREAKLADLLAGAAHGVDRLEASGVLVDAGCLWVIFDNVPHIARIDPALTPDHPGTLLLRHPSGPVGYEDIAHDREGDRYFLLIEAAERSPGVLMAQVHEYDRQFRAVARHWLDFPLERANKGIEGLACVRRDGRAHLLALCEGNFCRGGQVGRRPGGGRIHVFAEGEQGWNRLHTIHLPTSLRFTDYSGLSVAGDRVAVVSQESSALWVGRLHPDRWEVVDDGTTYLFPRDRRGRTTYGTIEGVSWLTPGSFAVVSDRVKPTQPARMRAKDQSVHVFALPEA